MHNYNGMICMYKPKGFTSFDVIAKLRGILKEKRIGHAGTLDPMADGVLPVFVGRATMACEMLPDHDKIYSAGFMLGKTTDTQDSTGTVLSESDIAVSEEDILGVLDDFRGEIDQIPPMYSAVSVNGQRLYDLARQNIVVERQPRKITIYRLVLTDYDSTSRTGHFIISCSRGTYIRTIINDIGERLGCGGIMTSLTRTKACGLDISQCITFEKLQETADRNGDFSIFIDPVEKVFEYLHEVYLTPFEERLYRNGIRLDTERVCFMGDASENGGRVRVSGTNGFIGTAMIDDDGTIKSEKTFVLRECEDHRGYYTIALGLFDGVHKGHRRVIETAVSDASKHRRRSAVFTFRTESVGVKSLSESCILTHEEKCRRIRKLGIETIFSPRFEDLCNMSAEDFVSKLLIERMHAGTLVCGEDFRFGRNASGDVSLLERICREKGCRLIVVPDIPDENGEKISSSHIRAYMENGEADKANDLMGEPISVEMPVITGNRIGHTMGFPTINQIYPENMQKLRFGVYASYVHIDGKKYPAITNIGVKPTVESDGKTLCETHIFDYDGDLYDRILRTEIIEFVRPERKFEGIEQLKKQISTDTEYIKNRVKSNEN